MRDLGRISILFAFSIALAAPGYAAPEEQGALHLASTPTITLKVPVSSEAFAGVPVARADDEVVTVRDLAKALETSHRNIAEGKPPPKINPVDIVNRLVNVRLFLKEARAIGVDELPEVKEELRSYSEQTIRKLILAELSKGARFDQAEADKIFQDDVKEYRLRSVMFPKEEDAKAMEADLKAGKTFDELAEKAVKEGKAKNSA